MHDGRHGARRRGQQRRHGRVAAEADDGRGPDARRERRSAGVPRASSAAVRASASGVRPRKVAARDDVDLLGGKAGAMRGDPHVGGEIDARAARRCSASASACGREQMPAGAAGRTKRGRRASASCRSDLPREPATRERLARFRHERSSADRGAAARQRQQDADGVREREHRRAAIGDERQRHALGRKQVAGSRPC